MLVELNFLDYAEGALAAYRPEADTDHTDLVLHSHGGAGHLDVQVKAATHEDREGRVVAFADYPAGAIPEGPRFVYVVCLFEHAAMERSRFWFVPSVDFNRLAYRERASANGRVNLQFSARAAGDPRWDPFEVRREQLALRALSLIASAPVDFDLHGGMLLVLN